MFTIKIIFGKLILLFISLANMFTGKERGTNLPGKLVLKLDKNFPRKFRDIDYSKVFFVTGTNGKSSTVNLLVHGLRSGGYKVISNLEGANLTSGITTALLRASNFSGKLNADYFVFETDERYLKSIHSHIPAQNLIITNIQKDQVQRNGDTDFIVRKIQSVIKEDMTLYLNNDEPRTKSMEKLASKVVYFGLNKNEKSFVKEGFLDVTMPCPICSSKLDFKYYNLDNIGKYICNSCGFSPCRTDNIIEKIDLTKKEFTMYGKNFPMPYLETFMLYNYSLTVTILKHIGIPTEKIALGLSTFVNQKGRTETFYYKGKEIHYLRIKQENPETLQSAFDVVSSDKRKKVFILGLMAVVDIIPNYTNTFYSYDCNIQNLLNSNVEKIICFGKPIAYDAANRFIYEGAEDKVKVLYTDEAEEIFEELNKYESDQVYLVTWIKTFFEMKEFIKKAENK